MNRHLSASLHRAAVALVLLAIAAGCGPTAYKITPVPVDRKLEEETILHEGGLAPPKVVLVDVEGLLLNCREFSLFGEGEHPVSVFVEKLDKAAKDPAVRALIVRINSPGGSVTAADLMHGELLNFKQRTGNRRPVVAVLMDVAASGGYYLACGADEIVAHPTTATGSIGVLLMMINFAGTMNKIGVTADAIASGAMKDAGSPFRKMTPKEREVFQTLVDQYFDRFVQTVVRGRPKLDEKRVRDIADGRVYSAQQALDLGLVDRIGTLHDALADVKKKIAVQRVRLVAYRRPLGYTPNIYAGQPAGPPQMNLINVQFPGLWPYAEPQFMYLWAPGQ